MNQNVRVLLGELKKWLIGFACSGAFMALAMWLMSL